ncbi:MAG: hypothetical protein AAF065_11405 [Verrucomicrobiota bacterium]
MKIIPRNASLTALVLASTVSTQAKEIWHINTAEEWNASVQSSEGLSFENGYVEPSMKTASYTSVLRQFESKTKASSITIKQTPEWMNWNSTKPVGPENLGNAPVILSIGPDNYWMFGAYQAFGGKKNKKTKVEMVEPFAAEDATLEGFDVPLKTTPYPNQFDSPGGLQPKTGGYHAWQSRDMIKWVHHGPVAPARANWTTTAEYVDGKFYIYYDFPNDQDPHLVIDEDPTDGLPGKDIGLVFKDPSNGSDCGIIRDLDGKFHLIYEDWSPINASKHSWDSPLAGRSVSDDGINDFKIMAPVVDHRTNPTGEIREHKHPHWHESDPENYPTNLASYEVHEPVQDAYGDWAAISVGGQYYLFGDFHPAGKKKEMSTAIFTSSSIEGPFEFFHHVGSGHPDPDITFAEGQFYLITQTPQDFVSPGPWVEKVEVRVGVDSSKDGKVDQWTDWQMVKERYDHIEGFAKQIAVEPASLDLSSLPAGYGFQFELRMTDTTENAAKPVLDQVSLFFTN